MDTLQHSELGSHPATLSFTPKLSEHKQDKDIALALMLHKSAAEKIEQAATERNNKLKEKYLNEALAKLQAVLAVTPLHCTLMLIARVQILLSRLPTEDANSFSSYSLITVSEHYPPLAKAVLLTALAIGNAPLPQATKDIHWMEACTIFGHLMDCDYIRLIRGAAAFQFSNTRWYMDSSCLLDVAIHHINCADFEQAKKQWKDTFEVEAEQNEWWNETITLCAWPFISRSKALLPDDAPEVINKAARKIFGPHLVVFLDLDPNVINEHQGELKQHANEGIGCLLLVVTSNLT